MKIRKYLLGVILSLSVVLLGATLIGIFCDKENRYLELCCYLLSYIILTVIYLYHEYDDLVSIKSFFVVIYTAMIGIDPLFYVLQRSTFITLSGNNIHYQYVICLVGYIFLLIGLFLFSNKKIVHNLKKLSDKEIKYYHTYGAIISVISTLANIYYICKYSNNFFGGNLESGRIDALSSNGIILLLCSLIIPSTVMLYYHYSKTKKGKYTFLISFAVLIITHIIRGGRAGIIRVLICAILIKNHDHPINMKKILTIGVVSVVALAFMQIQRTYMSGYNVTSLTRNIYGMFENGSINIDYIYDTFPEKTRYQMGYSYIVNIKMMKPGPDLDFTLWLKQIIGLNYSGGGLTPTLFGEGYLNFGYVGGFLELLFIGLVANYLNRQYKVNDKNTLWIVYVSSLFMDSFRGGFANIEIGLLTTLALYIAYRFIFMRKYGDLNETR